MQLMFALSVAIAGAMGQASPELPPPNQPPQLWRASALERDGVVVVRIARPKFKAPRVAGPAETMVWQELQEVTPGDSLHAFVVGGKQLGAEAVLKALRQPTGVAVFVQFYKPLLAPDPFYLSLLREGTVVLVVAADAIADPVP